MVFVKKYMKKNLLLLPLVLMYLSIYFISCDYNKHKKNVFEDNAFVNSVNNSKPIDGSKLELNPNEYVDWLKSNPGMTYNLFENDSVMVSILYQPIELQAAIGIGNSGMSYKELLKSKEGYHYFLVECLYKKMSAITNNKRQEYMDVVKRNICVIKSNTDTLRNVTIESFASSILNEPDNIMVLVPADKNNEDLICSINNETLGLNEIRINIPKKQFYLFPKLKI